jgi:hypothetical protein
VCRVVAVAASHEVVLADRTNDCEGVLGDVHGERSVGAVDVGVRAWVRDGGELDGGDDEPGDAAHGPYGAHAGHEDRRLAALVGEQVVGEDAASWPGGEDLLGVQRCVQLAESALVPRQRVVYVRGFDDGR